MKSQVSGSPPPLFSILFPCLFLFRSTWWMAECQRPPLEGTEWNELWSDVCFLWKQSFSCLSLESPTMLLFQRRKVSPWHALCVVQEALKSAGCHGDERQEQEELSTSPKQTHTNTRTNPLKDTAQKWCWTSKWNYGLAIQCFRFLINLNFVIQNYRCKCNGQKNCPLHNSVILINLYHQMTLYWCYPFCFPETGSYYVTRAILELTMQPRLAFWLPCMSLPSAEVIGLSCRA